MEQFDGSLPAVVSEDSCAVCGQVGRVAPCSFCGRDTCLDDQACMLEHLLGGCDCGNLCEGAAS